MTRRTLYAVGGFFGFSSGVASYTPRCAQMLMELDDSPIADELRKHMASSSLRCCRVSPPPPFLPSSPLPSSLPSPCVHHTLCIHHAHQAAQQSANVRGKEAAMQQSLDRTETGRRGDGGGGGAEPIVSSARRRTTD